jgi:hypothetical protein
MQVYIYQADIYCEDCGRKIRKRIKAEGNAPADPRDETTYDSDEYPKGPTADGGGESDKPEHCGACHCSLENSLTTDGVEYVLEHAAEALKRGSANDVEREWVESLADYSLTKIQARLVERFKRRFPAPDLSQARLWVRVGDGSDYEQFGDDLDAAIGHIQEHAPGLPLGNYQRGGIQTERYTGNNYISIYWGDTAANFVAELATDERAQVYRELDCEESRRD